MHYAALFRAVWSLVKRSFLSGKSNRCTVPEPRTGRLVRLLLYNSLLQTSRSLHNWPQIARHFFALAKVRTARMIVTIDFKSHQAPKKELLVEGDKLIGLIDLTCLHVSCVCRVQRRPSHQALHKLLLPLCQFCLRTTAVQL